VRNKNKDKKFKSNSKKKHVFDKKTKKIKSKSKKEHACDRRTEKHGAGA
jgi:hypothetical protein